MKKYTDTKTFHYFNANPKNKSTDDCVIRAICTATDKTWDEVFDSLMKIGMKYKLMPTDNKCYERYLKEIGWVKCSQPRKSDNTKYTGNEYCIKLNKSWANGYKDCSSVIAHIGGHHIVCIKWDGKNGFQVNDSWDSTNGCIGNYWVKANI